MISLVAFLAVGLLTSLAISVIANRLTSDRRRNRLAEVRRSSMQAERAIFDITQQAQAEMVRILMASRRRP